MNDHQRSYRIVCVLLALCLISIPLGLMFLPASVVRAHAESNGDDLRAGLLVSAMGAALPSTTHTVTNANDSGAGSLRDAISIAMSGDIIDFSLTYPATITLTSELFIAKDLAINGPDAISLTISGNNAVRVMRMNSGVTLNLLNVTIANGKPISGDGGGIYNIGGMLNIANSTVYSNTTTGYGGGIYNAGGTLNILDTNLYTNTATYGGGGIYNTGTLTVTNSAFFSNTADIGGGIYNGGTLNITNSTFSSNMATDNSFMGALGGGIANSGGILTVTDSTFSGNNAVIGIGGGGGIVNSGGMLTVTASIFSGNSAGYAGGGGILSTRGTTVTLTNNTFYSNTAISSGIGGGIVNAGTLTVTNNTFSSNSASNGGGGIANGGTLIVTNSTFSSNIASGNGGGGIANDFGGVLTLTNSTLSANSTSGNGGGINNFSGTVTLRNTIIANSTSGSNCAGTITDGGNNLQFNPNSGCASITAADPKLAPLANYGGPTQTMALLAGSPAIDTANPTYCPATDQRGVPRPQGSGCDIGAYEAILLFLPIIQK